MAPRPPADAVVALRSLGRRYRGLFAGLEDDESPDDLAHRRGPEGRSALDHVAAATRTITRLGRALEQVLVDEDPVVAAAAVTDPAEGEGPGRASVEGAIAQLASEAESLAARVEHVGAADWARTARLQGGPEERTALEILWDAVDQAVDHLRQAERVLKAVRAS